MVRRDRYTGCRCVSWPWARYRTSFRRLRLADFAPPPPPLHRNYVAEETALVVISQGNARGGGAFFAVSCLQAGRLHAYSIADRP